MRRFAYERPGTLAETSRLLLEAGAEACILAGGTDLVVGLRDGSIAPRVVIDIKRVAELGTEAISRMDGSLRFSALAVMSEVEADPRVLDELPALAEAARVVGSVQIRHRATLAGNICNGSPAADTAPPLLVYGATVVVSGPNGERRVAIDELILGPGRVALERGELVSAIEVPIPASGVGSAYTRLVRRRGTDLASVTMCAAVDREDRVRLAYGSVGPRAFLVRDDSGVLADPEAAPEARAAALEELLSQASPSPRSIRASPDYRLAMLRVLAMRALGVALERRAGSASRG
ncbi:MAG TPA: xanthine dehydrogenase family protein subunit M [Candidatus Limnocylindrales bacterium]|nr:xanthine dehydrogenase family protein subunit M [Candidatus Limnocylindrales bacterium]